MPRGSRSQSDSSAGYYPSKKSGAHAIAEAILQNKHEILNINQQEVEQCRQKGKGSAFLDRLALNIRSIESAAKGLEKIAELPDPVGSVIAEWKRPNGLHISRVRVPLGVIGVIYEARPAVTVDASGLCLKSGNAVILRGGSESFQTSQAFMTAIKQGLNAAGLPAIRSRCWLPQAGRQLMNFCKWIVIST